MKLYEVSKATHVNHPVLGNQRDVFYAVEFLNGTVMLESSFCLIFSSHKEFVDHYNKLGWEVKEVDEFVKHLPCDCDCHKEVDTPTPELLPEHLDQAEKEEKKPARKKRASKKKEKTIDWSTVKKNTDEPDLE